MSFRTHAISDETLTGVRTSGRDVSGHPVEPVVATGGEPLRCCLRDAEPGEDLILFGYEPALPASPYREIGPVFAHAQPCSTPPAAGYPAGWRGRRQVLRAYDKRGWIHPSTRVHDGTDPEAEIAAIFADPEVDRIHSRNVAYGCYMFAITR
ncbi:DUF1203 domain-containing protein [Asanoa iriomotensis]|uniref:DUF1203 domain-containing protein n=1 Tax=Asanoa iriomotensis TaxID=234613 RepID=A0ABQ4C4F1_9ACTN|nr:DUF1203 domain-containing protein [Asanoa iriomotensis]GIF57642.1 hypothetical protein Air01nite_37370 [Asanoa iriomotensis]